MEHIIAYNPYKNGNKGSVSSQPLSVYDKTIAYPWMADLVAAIRGGNDELKKQLPFRCAHYYQFRDNRRSQKNAVPESFLFQTTVDVDDKKYVDKAIEKARELNCSDTIWKGGSALKQSLSSHIWTIWCTNRAFPSMSFSDWPTTRSVSQKAKKSMKYVAHGVDHVNAAQAIALVAFQHSKAVEQVPRLNHQGHQKG